ncbi:GntR family transcriptional regulator [Flavimaricola marinus]|uniref:Putative HTH-type transcriptional regulator YdfH n=1 Tax=Flavimaricola marinus TaxID=1819565 RepID=A0A238LA55_9RHOB|nr:GntR family transcriptional regulator [Flavimaricola marinus]SMY06304.1 putative HTH-type transcriptional regulator YdfH [Flavimaricola marinus]
MTKASDRSQLPKAADAPLKKAAYDRFQQALLKGAIRPGQLVSQKELVALLDMSIGALRELLPRLEAEGLLTVMPQRGIQITMIDLPIIRDAFQMRMALEREAVISAVRTLPDEAIDEQERLHRDILARLEAGGDLPPDFFDEGQSVDGAFHELLVGCTRNDLLIHAYHVNSTRIRLIKLDRIKLTRLTLPSAFGDHLAVIEALKARDRAAAVAALEAHIRNARDRAIEL